VKRFGILSCPWSASRVLSPAPSARLEPAGSVVCAPPCLTTPRGHAACAALTYAPAGAPSSSAVDLPSTSEEILEIRQAESKHSPNRASDHSSPFTASEEMVFGLSCTRARSSETHLDLASSSARSPKSPVAGSLRDRCALVSSSTRALPSTRSEEFVDRSSQHPSSEARTRAVLPWGSLPYDVFEMWAATCTGIASPGFAPSSGFLNLLTSCSTLILTALFHAESVRGVEALRGFPLPVAATAFTARCPSASGPRTGLASVPARRPTNRRRPAPTPCSGIRAPGRSVHGGVVLPTPSADPLSAFFLSEGISP